MVGSPGEGPGWQRGAASQRAPQRPLWALLCRFITINEVSRVLTNAREQSARRRRWDGAAAAAWGGHSSSVGTALPQHLGTAAGNLGCWRDANPALAQINALYMMIATHLEDY